MLVGFLGVYGATGTFDLNAMRGAKLPDWVVAFILVGILSKSATFPLHSWLPDAGVAPSPVTSPAARGGAGQDRLSTPMPDCSSLPFILMQSLQ